MDFSNSCQTAFQESLEAWGGQLWKNWKKRFLKGILGNFKGFEPFLKKNFGENILIFDLTHIFENVAK